MRSTLPLLVTLALGGCPELGGRSDAGAASTDGGPAGGRDAGASDAGPAGLDAGPVTTHPTNILNNGGFETGLMCFGNWVWSQTGEDYKGDYDFRLSTDAHEGRYALEIHCKGTDCGGGAKAAIYTQRIHSPRSQPYKVTAWSKCAAGRRAYFYTPSSSAGDLIEDLTCNGAWVQNDITFTSSGSADDVMIYFYNADTTSLLLDDVILTYGDGTVPAQTVKHAGVRSVSVSGSVVSVDGAPYLALGFFDVPFDDLQAMFDLGGNTVTTLGLDEVVDCFNTRREKYGDRAFALGVGVLPDSTTTARLDEPAVLPAVMERFAPHRANLAWFLVDEPDQANVSWYYVPPATLVAEHDQARTVTRLPLIADFQRASWDQTSVVQPYGPSVEIYMAEPYGDDFGGVTHALDMFGTIGAKPTWLAMDPASASLIVAKAYFGIVEGATGILYFTWRDFRADSAKLAAAKQAFTELQSLREVLFAASADAEITAPAGVKAIARKHQGKTYLIAVNPGTQAITGDFTVAGLAAGKQVTVMFESRTVTSSAGKFSDRLEGTSRRVFLIE